MTQEEHWSHSFKRLMVEEVRSANLREVQTVSDWVSCSFLQNTVEQKKQNHGHHTNHSFNAIFIFL